MLHLVCYAYRLERMCPTCDIDISEFIYVLSYRVTLSNVNSARKSLNANFSCCLTEADGLSTEYGIWQIRITS